MIPCWVFKGIFLNLFLLFLYFFNFTVLNVDVKLVTLLVD